eukprot:1967313-Amphidinium_carterae.1
MLALLATWAILAWLAWTAVEAYRTGAFWVPALLLFCPLPVYFWIKMLNVVIKPRKSNGTSFKVLSALPQVLQWCDFLFPTLVLWSPCKVGSVVFDAAARRLSSILCWRKSRCTPYNPKLQLPVGVISDITSLSGSGEAGVYFLELLETVCPTAPHGERERETERLLKDDARMQQKMCILGQRFDAGLAEHAKIKARLVKLLPQDKHDNALQSLLTT